MSTRDPAAWYREQADRSAHLAGAAAAHVRRIGHLRLVAFALIVAAATWVATTAPRFSLVARAALVLAIAAFAVLVVYHRRARALQAGLEQRRLYHELALHRLARDWSALPVPRASSVASDHPYAADLGIIGRAGLLQLVDVVSSAPGRPTLLRWLLDAPPSAPTILERQAAARELAARDDIRVELGVTARGIGELDHASVERFLAWCERPGSLIDHPAAVWAGRVTTALILGAFLLQAAGVLSHPYWLIVVVIGRAVRLYIRRRAKDASTLPSVSLPALRGHRAMLALLADATFEAPLLVRQTDQLREGDGAAHQLTRLERIAAWGEVRNSPLLHFALEWLLLWDLHVDVALEHWKRRAGRTMRDWMRALGDIETLAALGTLAHDQPDWTFPSMRDDVETVLEASALAHPLLPNETRVANDVTIGPPGTFLLITGSNMSGKSTLLRAIGVNAVLAQAGGPVCATRYRSSTLSIRTSIRVEDSLADGISLFMAELRRIKSIVDAARAREGGVPVLYLLDEILHGTNSAERRVAARIVIGHLLEAGAIGAVTTHDLTLATDGPIAAAAKPVSFTESVDRTSGAPVLHFGYRLHDGLATSSNALALLDIVGLGPST